VVPRPGRRLSRGRARHRLPARRYRGNAGDDRRHRRRCRQDLGAAADRRAARSTTGDHPLAAGRPVADRRWAQRYWQATDPWPGGGTDLKKAVALTRPFFPRRRRRRAPISIGSLSRPSVLSTKSGVPSCGWRWRLPNTAPGPAPRWNWRLPENLSDLGVKDLRKSRGRATEKRRSPTSRPTPTRQFRSSSCDRRRLPPIQASGGRLCRVTPRAAVSVSG